MKILIICSTSFYDRIKDLKIEYTTLNSKGEYKIGIMYLKQEVNLKALRILKQRLFI